MSMTFTNQLGVIPALLIALACVLVLRRVEPEYAQRRLLLFLLGLGVLLNSARYITMRYVTEPYNQPFFELSNLLAPSMLGITAMVLLNIKGISKMGQNTRMVAIILGIVFCVLYGLVWRNQVGIEYLIVPGTLILAIGWVLGMRSPRLTLILGWLSVAVHASLNWIFTHPIDYSEIPTPRILGSIIFILIYVSPGLSTVVSALLVTQGIQAIAGNAGTFGKEILKIGFAVMVILFMAYTIYWGSIWDNTSDGLLGVFALYPSALVAIGSGMIMMLVLRGRQRIVGTVFLVAAPLILYQSFEAGWRVSYHKITEGRAERIAQALERFHAREGSYPESLDELTPRDLLFIQQPVILAGEKWCYESGGNSYRLSAFYREAFSMPVSLHTYESAGDLPLGPPICEERLAEMKQKYYSPMEDPNAMRPPLPTPLPDIEVGLPKTEIGPILNGSIALPGSWSPDGTYYFFGTQKDDHVELHFLIGETGEVCTADMQYSSVGGLRESHAWLPGGRLLYAESSGYLTVLTPCQIGAQHLTGRLPETLDPVSAYPSQSGRVLLYDKDAFWILDGNTLEMQKISDVTPNPYEIHWDRYAWLSDGDNLVIARLNGRQGSKSGVTLFLIDGATAEVQNSFELEGEFGQGAPWVEGLIDDQVLIHSQGELLIADFSTSPVTITNVMKDIFDLDINFPDEISAAGSHADKNGNGYYLSVRLNHPHNQSTYLYYSVSKRVYVYEHEYHTLLLFPDGYSMDMQKLETVPTYQDEYYVVKVDAPETVYPALKITGHTPREYPQLSIAYLKDRYQLAVASAHGVSLVSLPGGEMQAYWILAGDGFSPWLSASPNGSALVASKDYGGLYYIPLP
jgi:hypothetical protein